VITDKDIVSEALTKGSWQVSLQHALTQIDLDQSQVALTFSPTGDVNAQRLESSSGQLTRYDGAYALFYDHDDDYAPNPDYDDLNDGYEGNEEEDLFLSFAFARNEAIILNHRWKLKKYTANMVLLQANDIKLSLNKVDSE
jgi:hypothetical protein